VGVVVHVEGGFSADVRNLANPYGGNGPRKISLAKPGTLEKHLDEMKFQERLKSYGWSDKSKSKIKTN